MQAAALGVLLAHPLLSRREIDLETNGTRPLGATEGWWSTITCSPKVGPSAGQRPGVARVHPSLLDASPDFKFVVRHSDDLAAAEAFVRKHALDAAQIWVMPEGVSSEALLPRTQWLASAAAERGWNFSHRLHVLAWGDERGH